MADSFDKIKEALEHIKPAEFEWSSDSRDIGVTAPTTDDVLNDTIMIDTSLWGTININTTGSYTTGAMGSSYLYSGNNGSSMWSTAVGTNTPSLSVSGDAEFEGDVKIKGVSISKTLEDIQKRLVILVPDPEKLEHFESLKKAYEHYKTLEALCQVPTKEKEIK